MPGRALAPGLLILGASSGMACLGAGTPVDAPPFDEDIVSWLMLLAPEQAEPVLVFGQRSPTDEIELNLVLPGTPVSGFAIGFECESFDELQFDPSSPNYEQPAPARPPDAAFEIELGSGTSTWSKLDDLEAAYAALGLELRRPGPCRYHSRTVSDLEHLGDQALYALPLPDGSVLSSFLHDPVQPGHFLMHRTLPDGQTITWERSVSFPGAGAFVEASGELWLAGLQGQLWHGRFEDLDEAEDRFVREPEDPAAEYCLGIQGLLVGVTRGSDGVARAFTMSGGGHIGAYTAGQWTNVQAAVQLDCDEDMAVGVASTGEVFLSYPSGPIENRIRYFDPTTSTVSAVVHPGWEPKAIVEHSELGLVFADRLSNLYVRDKTGFRAIHPSSIARRDPTVLAELGGRLVVGGGGGWLDQYLPALEDFCETPVATELGQIRRGARLGDDAVLAIPSGHLEGRPAWIIRTIEDERCAPPPN